MTTSGPPAGADLHDRRVRRRALLAGAAGVSVGAAVGVPVGAAQAVPVASRHGLELRGLYLPRKDRMVEGRFGVMFKRLPAFAPPDVLLESLAASMVEDQTVPDDAHINTSSRLFAGYTFIGQFIDHDITFDDTPLSAEQADPDARINFRTPRYDLDSVYGRGPTHEPQFYDPSDPDKLLVTANVHGVDDVPRDGDRAVLPDRRNDQSLILVQLHRAFAQFHNNVVDHVRAQGVRREWVFETARRITRWHYQWAVVHDFLPRLVGGELVGPKGAVYREVEGRPPVITLRHYRPTNKDGRPFIPVEFAVAAYRFGHSLVRPFYVINDTTLQRGGVPVFGPDGGFNLNGGRPVPSDLVVDWKFLLRVDPDFPVRKPRRLDTNLSLPLATLPDSVVPPPDAVLNLAVRNTLRGKRVGLPSGQQVAGAMRLAPLSNRTLGLSSDPGWGGEAPLWYYVLKEAELPPYDAERLGPVGGRIISEVLVGLLKRDPTSYLRRPGWKPSPPLAPETGVFGFVDLLRYAGAA